LNNYSNHIKEISSSNNYASFKDKGRLKKSILYTKCFIPFLLSHHPECEKFKGHTIKCRGKELCIGCFIGYPTAIIALPILTLAKINKLIPSHLLFLMSIIFISTFFLSPLHLIKNKTIKIFQKFLIGFGAALLIIWIMSLPQPRSSNITTAFIVFYILLVLLNLYHAYGILHTCYKCETPFDWGKCSGFCTIRERMEKYNLNNFLLNLEQLSNKIKEKKIQKGKKN